MLPHDDFACLKEALQRRLNELKRAEDDSFSNRPDLIIIDGGKGQLSSTFEVLKENGFDDIKIISLAKQFEEVFVTNSKTPIMLKRSSEELKLLQRIRDEAHRFAITFHRNIRNSSQFHDPLDEINGIGLKKRIALYTEFKTLENIKNAKVEELCLIKGITKDLANKIQMHLRGEKANE